MEFSKACVDICSSNEIILVHLIYWNRKFGHQWDSPREDNHMSALVPVCWMLKLPGIPKHSEDIWQLCSRLASIGSGAQAYTICLTRGGPSHPGWLAGVVQRLRVSAGAAAWRRPTPAWKAMGRRVVRTGSEGETARQRRPHHDTRHGNVRVARMMCKPAA